MIRLLAGMLIGFTLSLAGSSFSEDRAKITADLGFANCRHTPSPDGQWYQKDQDHSNRYKGGCGTFGLSIPVSGNWTAGIHYVSLGRVETHALAVNFPGDDRANMTAEINPRRAECRESMKEGCLYQWHTGSSTHGLNFSASYLLFNLGDASIEAKGGLYVHKLSNAAVVEPLGCRDNCAWRGHLDQSATRIAPMWGGVVRWKWLYASWEFYERIGEHTPVTANIKGRVEVKTIGVSIPL